MIKLATFDIDGTLMRRHENALTLKIEAFDMAVRRIFGIPQFNYLNHLKPSMYGMTDRSIMRVLMLELGVDKVELEAKFELLFETIFAYFNSHPEHTTDLDYYLLPGVEELLERMKNAGILMGLATGNYQLFARWKVDGLGIGDYFTFGGFGNKAEDRAEIVGIALKLGGLNGKGAIHFGDTPVDIKAAHSNRILAGAITLEGGATHDRDLLLKAGADLIIDSWQDIDPIMEFIENQAE